MIMPSESQLAAALEEFWNNFEDWNNEDAQIISTQDFVLKIIAAAMNNEGNPT